MHSLIEKESLITVKAIFLDSDNDNYRYMLIKTWNNNKPKATMIGINPSKATHLKGDNTATNAMNYFIDSGYGSMMIVNLFACMCIKPSELKKRKKEYEKLNDDYIRKACEESDFILVAWGYDKNQYSDRKEEVNNILEPYRYKAKCFMDKNNNKPQHLRIMSNKWKLVEY